METENPIVTALSEQVGKILDNDFSPVGKWLSGTLKAVKAGECTVDFTVRQEMTNPVGTIHGGMVALMCDEVIGMTAYTLYNEYHFTSVNLVVDFLSKAVKGEVLSVTAKVMRKGRTIINLECLVHNTDGKLVARTQQNMVRTAIKLW